MKTIVCAEWGAPMFGYPATVILYQSGVDSFAVRYGRQLTACLPYHLAAAEFGQCVMHAAACDSTLNNQTRTEAKRDGVTAVTTLRDLQPHELRTN